MKKYLFAFSALFLLASCELFPIQDETDEPEQPEDFVTVSLTDKIEISDVEMTYSYEITDVALVARFNGHQGSGKPTTNDEGVDMRVMLRGVPFDRKSMKLELPENPPVELLRDIATDFPDGFEFSNPEAQTISNVEIACNLSDNNHFYMFLHQRMDAGHVTYEVRYIYCDRPTTVTGTGGDWWGHHTTYDLSLEKGWNMYVVKDYWNSEVRVKTINHRMPSNIKWKQNMWIGGC